MATKGFLWLLLLVFFSGRLDAQDSGKPAAYTLSLNDVIRIARDQNKQVKAAKEEEKASAFDLRDAKDAILPYVAADGNYQGRELEEDEVVKQARVEIWKQEEKVILWKI